ncbi:MAG: hypothetical protein ACTSRS_19115 [Candidatus Helarchaeota archaeon]
MTVELKIRGEMIIERDNIIANLQKKIEDMETQIAIFKNQIAPALEQTITELREQESSLKKTIEAQANELQMKNQRITAAKQILKRFGQGEVLKLEDFQIIIGQQEGQIKVLKNTINKLQYQVEQLPYICVKMADEIKKRESQIHSLKIYNSVLNKKLHQIQQKLAIKSHRTEGTINELSNKMIALSDQLQKEREKVALLDKEILMLNGIIMEKEAKINQLEAKIQNLIFK